MSEHDYRFFDLKEISASKIKLFYIPNNKFFNIITSEGKIVSKKIFNISICKNDRKNIAFDSIDFRAHYSRNNTKDFIQIYIKNATEVEFKTNLEISFTLCRRPISFYDLRFLTKFYLVEKKALDFFSGCSEVDIEKEEIFFLSDKEKESFRKGQKKLYYISEGFFFKIAFPTFEKKGGVNTFYTVKVISLGNKPFFFDSVGKAYFPKDLSNFSIYVEDRQTSEETFKSYLSFLT